jgi:hypothetical protein
VSEDYTETREEPADDDVEAHLKPEKPEEPDVEGHRLMQAADEKPEKPE